MVRRRCMSTAAGRRAWVRERLPYGEPSARTLRIPCEAGGEQDELLCEWKPFAP
jgi:hypothetical protein